MSWQLLLFPERLKISDGNLCVFPVVLLRIYALGFIHEMLSILLQKNTFIYKWAASIMNMEYIETSNVTFYSTIRDLQGNLFFLIFWIPS